MKVSKSTLMLLVVGGLVFSLSLFIAPYYKYGDQATYRALYEGMQGLSWWDSWVWYTRIINSVEPGTAFVYWGSSNIGIGKDFLQALLNVMLAMLVFLVLRRLGAKYLLIFVLLFTNYYAFVLYFAADRLKLSFLFFFAAILFGLRSPSVRNRVLAGISTLAALVTHAQMIITALVLLSGRLGGWMASSRTQSISRYRTYSVTGTIAVVLVSVFFVRGQIAEKFSGFTLHDLDVVLKAVFPFAAALWVVYHFRDRSSAIGSPHKSLATRREAVGQVMGFFAPLFLAILILGPTRLNILAFFGFVYFSLRWNGGVNPPVIALSIYYCINAIDFLRNIIIYGNGYYRAANLDAETMLSRWSSVVPWSA